MADLAVTAPQADAVTETTSQTDTAATSPEPAAQPTFDAAYVKQLRAEAAAARTANKDMEARLKALELEKLTETERTQRERDEFKARAEQLEADLAKRERAALCSRVAASVFKDTARAEWVAARLVGETEAELLADAKESLKLFAQAAPPDDLGRNGGGKPDPAAVSDAQRQQHAKQYATRF